MDVIMIATAITIIMITKTINMMTTFASGPGMITY